MEKKLENKSLPMEVLIEKLENGEIGVADAFRMLPRTVTANREKLEEERQKRLNEIVAELDSLVGLREVKKLVKEIYAFIEIQKRREKEKLVNEPLVLHMIFSGNPLSLPVK